ncbi:hypothetical protein EDC04DRAFT_2836799, partial [Pisolithus marmoratus]
TSNPLFLLCWGALAMQTQMLNVSGLSCHFFPNLTPLWHPLSCLAMASVVMLGPDALTFVVLPSCHQVVFPHTCQLKLF